MIEDKRSKRQDSSNSRTRTDLGLNTALARTHTVHNFDEVWAINAVSNVIYHDRVFMMDPASRFLDTDDAGLQTDASMTEVLTKPSKVLFILVKLDDRCPGLR